MYTVHCTLYTLHSTQYTVHCTLYTVHCTLYTVHCMYTLPLTLNVYRRQQLCSLNMGFCSSWGGTQMAPESATVTCWEISLGALRLESSWLLVKVFTGHDTSWDLHLLITVSQLQITDHSTVTEQNTALWTAHCSAQYIAVHSVQYIAVHSVLCTVQYYTVHSVHCTVLMWGYDYTTTEYIRPGRVSCQSDITSGLAHISVIIAEARLSQPRLSGLLLEPSADNPCSAFKEF